MEGLNSRLVSIEQAKELYLHSKDAVNKEKPTESNLFQDILKEKAESIPFMNTFRLINSCCINF